MMPCLPLGGQVHEAEQAQASEPDGRGLRSSEKPLTLSEPQRPGL